MARPNAPRGKGPAGRRTGNPFTNWLKSREQRRMEAQEQAARLITDSIAENQQKIIDVLSSVDFLHSKLPKAVLEERAKESQRYCNLELATRVIIQKLVKDPQNITMDIRPFDEKLMTLVLLFKQAVEQGDTRAAYAAKAALVRAVRDIRSRIPQNQPELAKQFVELNTQYLDQWITLVTMAQVADRVKQNLAEQEIQYEKSVQEDEARTDTLYESIQKDAALAEAFAEVTSGSLPDNRQLWNPDQREVHRLMVERRMGKVKLELDSFVVEQTRIDLTARENDVDMLHTKVATLPIVTDPNLMAKHREAIAQLFKDLADTDARIDESLRAMDEIEGQLRQLESAPGTVRAREVAAEEGQRALKEMQEREKLRTGEAGQRSRDLLNSMGLRTPEQLEEKRRQVEAEEQQALQEMEEEVQDAEVLYT